MLDFPASPTIGQQYTAAGVTWVWDGVKWVASGTSGSGSFPEAPTDGNAYMRSNSAWSSGGTLTGSLNLSASYGGANFYATGLTFNAIAQYYGVQLLAQYGGLNRWIVNLLDGSPESGGDLGNDFVIQRADDTGYNNPDPVLKISRATGQVTIPNLSAPGVPGMGDNRLINGDMRINQRGEDGYTMGVYVVDRWYWTGYSGIGGGANPIGTGICVPMQDAGPPEFPYCLGINFGSFPLDADDYFQIFQAIEADAISDFAWGTANAQPVTLSFWALAYNLAGSYGGVINNADGTRSYPFSYNLPNIQVWTKVSVVIPGDTAGTWTLFGNGSGVLVHFDVGSGDTYRAPAGAWYDQNLVGASGTIRLPDISGGGWLYITGVKLETGSVATPFNHQSLAKSMVDCQRYYQKIGGATYANCIVQGYGPGSPCTVTIGYQIMRAVPTATMVGNWTTSDTTVALFPGVQSLGLQGNPGPSQQVNVYNNDDTGFITLDADL